MADDEAEILDLDQFGGLDDALDQLANSRVYDDVLKATFARPHTYSILTVFAHSSCIRFRGLHEGIVREVAASNPHAALSVGCDMVDERVDLVALELLRLVSTRGFRDVYDELCEVTHFGSVALWQPHVLEDATTVKWRSEPRWKDDREPLIACAQLKEMSAAAQTYLYNFAGRHILE